MEDSEMSVDFEISVNSVLSENSGFCSFFEVCAN